MTRALALLGTAVLVAAPLLYWIGDAWGGRRIVGMIALAALIGLLGARLAAGTRPDWRFGRTALPLGAVALAFLFDRRDVLFALPVVISAVLLAVFGSSLAPGRTPIVERIARGMDRASMTPDRVAYCRTVTIVWCVFFAFNAIVAVGLSLYASFAAWSLYTGIVAYALIGLLFAAEYAVRRIRFH